MNTCPKGHIFAQSEDFTSAELRDCRDCLLDEIAAAPKLKALNEEANTDEDVPSPA